MIDAHRRLLADIYVSNIRGKRYKATGDAGVLKRLMDDGYLKSVGGSVHLTPLGRSKIRVIFTGGVFDVIHPGHIYTLRTAKSRGDALIVSVARQVNVMKFKKKVPLHDERLRMELVQSVRFVDLAMLGDERDIMKTVELIKPDLIVLGYDQFHQAEDLILEGRKRGLDFKVERLSSPYPDIKTRSIATDPARLRTF